MRCLLFVASILLISQTDQARTHSFQVHTPDGKTLMLNDANFVSNEVVSGVLASAKSESKDPSPGETKEHPFERVRVIGQQSRYGRTSLVFFANRDRLACRVDKLADEKLTVQCTAIAKPFSVPSTSVVGILLDPELSENRVAVFAARLRSTNLKSDFVLLSNNDVITGLIEEITEQEIKISVNEEIRAINRGLVTGIGFDPSSVEPAKEQVKARISLNDGSRLSLTKLEISPKQIQLATEAFDLQTIRSDTITQLELLNPKVVNLATQTPSEQHSHAYFSNGPDVVFGANVLGVPAKMQGEEVAEVIGMLSGSSVSFDVSGFHSFQATVGLDDRAGFDASCEFRVLLDGKQAFTSQEMTIHSRTKDVKIPLNGAKTLTLEVGFAKRGDAQDYANWCRPRLLRK